MPTPIPIDTRTRPPPRDLNVASWPKAASEPPKPGLRPTGRGRFWQRLRAREDSEHEQVLIRIGFAAAILLVLLAVTLSDEPPAILGACLIIAAGYLVGSVTLFADLLRRPQISPARRYAGMLLDLTTLPLGMIVGGWLVAPLYPMYLWVTLGMGFRYGRRYLYAAALASLVGFALVVALTDFWRAQPAFSATLWLALLVLPAYSSTLLTKLTAALDRAEEASQAKSRFLATMSHELRTPLHAILGMADLLHRARLDGEQQEMVQTVRSAGQNLLELIDDLLDVARIEAGHGLLEASDFDLDAVVATVRALLHHQAHAKGLALRVQIEPALPHRLHGAARSLQQVMVNLVVNAIKFTERGGVTLRLRGTPTSPTEILLRVEVEDSGVGIPETALGRIFDPFTQVDGSATRRHGGSGLGLAIVRQLVQLMGGTLTVESDPGIGTRFAVEVLFTTHDDEMPPARSQGRLVVVGDPDLAGPWCRRLAAPGLEVLSTADPASAAEMLQAAGGARAVAVVGTAPAARAEARLAELARRLAPDPVSMIGLGDPGPIGAAHCLMTLPLDCPDRALERARHAALATPLVGAVPRPGATTEPRPARRVLVAEDNRTNQKVIQRMLRSGGHDATLVGDGEQALQALEAGGFDLALIDLNMPVIDGLDMLKIHRFATGGRDPTPIVALSADATEATRRQCTEAGFDAHLTKPVDLDRLLGVIDRLTREGRADPPPPARLSPIMIEPEAAGDCSPVLDFHQLARLHQLGKEDDFLAEVIQDFIADGEQLVAELAEAAAAADAVTFRDRAHALRSSAAHLGAMALFELCLGWRSMNPAELRVHGREHTTRVAAEFERLRTALQALAIEPPPPDPPPAVSPRQH